MLLFLLHLAKGTKKLGKNEALCPNQPIMGQKILLNKLRLTKAMTITTNFVLSNEEVQSFDVQGMLYKAEATISSQSNSILYKAAMPNFENLALDVGLPQNVAIKIFFNDHKYPNNNVNRSLREAGALQRIKHANVVRFYDITQEEDFAFLALEYIDGVDLGTYLRQVDRPLPLKNAVSYIEQALLALEAVHNSGVIHRDIKPENLMLTKNGTIKLIDFTTALIPGEMYPMANNNEAIGTFDYIAPECLEGYANSKESDIYALGVSFYQMLTNSMPFAGNAFNDQLKQKFAGNYVPIKKINKKMPQVITAVLDRALCPDPQGRYHSAREFLNDLKQYEGVIGLYISRYEQNEEIEDLAAAIDVIRTKPRVRQENAPKVFKLEEITSSTEEKRFGRFTQLFLMFGAAVTLSLLVLGHQFY